MRSIARPWAIGCLLALAVLPLSSAQAQLGDEVPHASYYLAKGVFYSGEYRDAERGLRRERGVRAGGTNWIDAICYHAMLGETLYHQGRNAEALAEFDESCQVFLAYPNWLLQVKFQSTGAGGLRADVNRARRVPPWGQSTRTFVLGQFPDAEQVLVGDLNAQQAYQTGGVVRAPMYWRVNIVEIMRCTALAIRRRNELLGPLAAQDTISKQLSSALSSSKLAPANHWSGAWIDLLRGLAQQGVGKLDEADMMLGRSLVVDGQFDHPLTCVALLEQGRIAVAKGDLRRAAQMFAEAGYSSFYFEDYDVLTESTLGGWLNHLASNAPGVYPPLDTIAAWAQTNRVLHVSVKLRLAEAESLLWLGQLPAAASWMEDAGRRIGEMRTGLPGVHLTYLQSALQLLQGKIEQGGETLSRAIIAQAGLSHRNFQIARIGQMYDARAASPRVAVDMYKVLLADPTPAEWVRDPLDAMAVLQTNQDGAFDRWFVGALERKEASLALEIAERAKRRRYLSTQPFGGRMVSLRAILESPVTDLSQEAMLQRQFIFGKFPEYQSLADLGMKVRDQLIASPILPSNPAETKSLNQFYDTLEQSAVKRQHLLSQIAVRRLASACEFPPLRSTAELQKTLGPNEALLEFHTAAGNLYGFHLTSADARIWQLPESRKLRAGLADFLKAMGNYGANRQMTVAELKADAWREASKGAYAVLFGEGKIDLAKTTSLVIVPDDLLWYLPFEVLTPATAVNAAANNPPNAGANLEKVLADRMSIRYGPTGALAIARPQPLRRPKHTGIVANELKFGGDDNDQAALVQELETAFTGPIVFGESLPQPGSLISPLVDELVVMDDVSPGAALGEAASLLPRSKGGSKDLQNSWITLPFGGPEQVVLTGVATEAEQGLKPPKRSSSRASANVSSHPAAGPGSEIFQSLCNLMSGGARTVLMTRWRTGGHTNFDLVREFAKELPNGPASEAWQRACLLAREAPLDMTREPRLKRSDDGGDLPTADHPFFWSGYILVDTGPRPEVAPPVAATPGGKAAPANPNQPNPPAPGDGKLPPPEKPGAAGDAPPATKDAPAVKGEEKMDEKKEMPSPPKDEKAEKSL